MASRFRVRYRSESPYNPGNHLSGAISKEEDAVEFANRLAAIPTTVMVEVVEEVVTVTIGRIIPVKGGLANLADGN